MFNHFYFFIRLYHLSNVDSSKLISKFAAKGRMEDVIAHLVLKLRMRESTLCAMHHIDSNLFFSSYLQPYPLAIGDYFLIYYSAAICTAASIQQIAQRWYGILLTIFIAHKITLSSFRFFPGRAKGISRIFEGEHRL